MIEETIIHKNIEPTLPYLTYHQDHNYSKFKHRKSILLTLHHESTLEKISKTYITGDRLEFLKTNDNLLIIDMSLEGRYDIVELIYNILILSFKIPENNILLVCSSKDYYKEIEKVSKSKFRKPIHCEVYYYFERRMRDSIIEENFVPIIEKNKERLYLNFNRIARPNRLFLMDLLLENKLYDVGFNSLGDKCSLHCSLDFTLKQTKIKFKKFNIERIKKIIPITLDTSDFSKNLAMVTLTSIRKYYEKSLISLVTETNYDNNYPVFFTEKTFKPIANKQPFILISSPNSLARLRDLGYKTFNNIIDESYDDIQDDNLRLLAIVAEINRLAKLNTLEFIEKTTEITEHNYNNLRSKSNFIPLQTTQSIYI